MKGYFVIDKQQTGWKEGYLWKSIKEIADSIRNYDDFQELEASNLTHSQVCDLWDFEYHRITPANCEKYGVKPNDLEREVIFTYDKRKREGK
jgi:hypothetical protein